MSKPTWTVHLGDALTALQAMPEASVYCCVTSPPYFGLRDYGMEGQLGLEETPEAYVHGMVSVFREVRRVLRPDGTLWLNLGDSYTGSASTGGTGKETDYTGKRSLPNKRAEGLKAKDLIGIPWRVAFALQADGWYLRQDIIWHKPNPMPESVKDRCTKAHEQVFLLAKAERYYFDAAAIAEPATGRPCGNTAPTAFASADPVKGRTAANLHKIPAVESRNRRSVWTIPTSPFPDAHFATFPEALVEPCILAGCPVGGVVLDPFTGSGTTGAVARRLGRGFVGIELNPKYHAMALRRINQAGVGLGLA